MKDSTAILCVMLLPIFLLIVSYGNLVPFKTEFDQIGVIISGWIGLGVFTLCFFIVKKRESYLRGMNKA